MISGMFYTMTRCKRHWNHTETKRNWRNMQDIIQNSMEAYRSNWKLLVSYTARARLTPTLTHVVMRDPMTSGAKARAMSSLSI